MEENKLRAVIYCRCSTEEESQRNALTQQVHEARECVEKKDWILTGEYVESKSGTSVSGRSAYLRLFRDLEGKFYTPEDNLIVGIKAILAEDYSRELSKKINNAHHHRHLQDMVETGYPTCYMRRVFAVGQKRKFLIHPSGG